jgi:uncharacterized protein (TIGR00369 family)
MEFKVRIPFIEHLGVTLERFEPGVAALAIELREELTNTWGVAHGGVLMTLLDVAMAHAARTPSEQGAAIEAGGVVTVEMKTTFMRPGVGRLVAEGTRLHRTATMAFCEGAVRDAGGKIVGHATGTFKYVSGLSVDGRRVQRPNASD